MTSISTKILDHIVHLTPPGSVEATSEQFRKLGFKYVTSYDTRRISSSPSEWFLAVHTRVD